MLVADDDDFNFFVVESFLAPYKYKVIHAENGEEAVRILNSQKNISLVIMDIQMPVMDGFAATEEIRKVDKNIPIIVNTSYANGKIKEKAINSGCNEFLSKPLNFDLLLHTIEKYVR